MINLLLFILGCLTGAVFIAAVGLVTRACVYLWGSAGKEAEHKLECPTGLHYLDECDCGINDKEDKRQ